MTTDHHLFKTEPGVGRLPLYEGKMIHQFESSLAMPRYWIEEKEGRSSTIGRNSEDSQQKLPYQKYRFAHRAIARNTDTRTMIGSILPAGCFFGHSMNATIDPVDTSELLVLTALLNSFIFDYFLRQMVTANLTMFFIYQCPVPRLTAQDPKFAPIVTRAARLICTSPEFDALAQAVNLNHHGATDPTERAPLRAELDGLIAHLYGLDDHEFAHILTTFPLVPEPTKTAALAAYRALA